MSTLRRWEGNPDAPSLREEVNRLFDDFFTGGMLSRDRGGLWSPALDVAETPTSVIVKAEIPGIQPEAVDVQLTGNVLTLRGEKKDEREEKDRNWHRVERSYGSFTRSVALPEGVDPEKVNASYENGILTIDVAKRESARPRSIKVNVKK